MRKQNALLCLLSLYILIFLSLPIPSSSERCNPNDKKVLLQIKESLNNPYHLASWIPENDCCHWYDVDCDLKTNRVIALSIFTDTNITGQIPAAVGDLPYLQSLTFRKLPNITGSIPLSITKLKHLQMLDLSWNSLSGPIPPFLRLLKSLIDLDLSFNKFTGSIPASLSQLTNLMSLHLDRNQLTGSIPDSFGDFSRNAQLYGIHLSHNQLTGSIPRSLRSLNLTVFDVSRNKLIGDISFMFGSNKTVEIVDFSRNMFGFDLTKVVFPASLTSLDLNHNSVYGSLPEGLTGLNLQYLNVSYNRLCGQIPVGGKLQSFDEYEYLHNKCLCGAPLPACKK